MSCEHPIDLPCSNFFQAGRRACAATVTLLCIAMLAPPATAQSDGDGVRAEALKTYIHGITDEIAQSRIGPQGVPVLLELLADPTFPRRDNVVAHLGWLGSGAATDALLAFLNDPPADVRLPEEDRALLLAPQSLGHIAGRGNPRALKALLDMTAEASNGGVLAAAAAHGERPSALRDDLLEILHGPALEGEEDHGKRRCWRMERTR